MKSNKIDFSEIPELSDKQLFLHASDRPANRGRRAETRLIAIRLDARVLGWLRRTAEKKGLPYQLFVNEILADEMHKAGCSILRPRPEAFSSQCRKIALTTARKLQ